MPAKKQAAKTADTRSLIGRPSKLNSQTRDKIVQAIALGLTYDRACDLAGMSYQTLRNWIARGGEETEGEYFDFLDALKKAEAQGEAACVQRIHKAAQGGQWQAAAWLLERRYPERWGRRERHIHESPDGSAVFQPIVDAIHNIYGNSVEEGGGDE